MSLILTLDSSSVPDQNSDKYTIAFPRPIELDPYKTWMISLVRADMWYSYFNVQASQSTNVLRYSPDNQVTWKNFVIPDGAYNIIDIQNAFEEYMNQQGDFDLDLDGNPVYHIQILANTNTLRTEIVIDDANYSLDLDEGNIYRLFGFNAGTGILSGIGTFISDNLADITDGVNSLLINVSIAENAYQNNINKGTLYTVVPTSPPGSNINITPSQLIWAQVKQSDRRIRQITVEITDNQGRRIDFNEQPVTVLLSIKEKGLP